MIKKKDVQKAAKKAADAVVEAGEDAYRAVSKAAAPKLKALKKAAAPKVKQARKAVEKQVAKGVKQARSLTKDALNASAKGLQRAAKKICRMRGGRAAARHPHPFFPA
jgi:hypothetical protein